MHFTLFWPRSNINEKYLIHLHFIRRVRCEDSSVALLHCALYMDACHDDSSRRNLFLEDYPISASLFVFRGYNTKLFSKCIFYTSVTSSDTFERRQLNSHRIRPPQTTTPHPHTFSGPTHVSLFTWLDIMTRALRMTTPLINSGSARIHVRLLTRLDITTTQFTSVTCTPNESNSFTKLLCWRTCKSPSSTWYDEKSTLSHTGPGRICAHFLWIRHHRSDLPRILWEACLYKGLICTYHAWFC